MADRKPPARSRKKAAEATDATDESLIPDTPPVPETADKASVIEDAVIVQEDHGPPTMDDAKPDVTDEQVMEADKPVEADTVAGSDTSQTETPAAEDTVPGTEPMAEAGSDVEPDPVRPEPPAQTQKVVERVIEKRGSVVPMIVAGVVIAAAGFVAGRSDLLPDTNPVPPDLSSDVAALTERLSGLEGTVSEIGARPAAEAPPPDLSAIEGRLSGIDATLADLTARSDAIDEALGDLDARITDLAARPVTDAASDAAVAAFEAELAGLQASIAEQRAEVEQMVAAARQTEAEAAEQARRAEIKAAVARLVAALDRGEDLQAELAALSGLGITVPDALANSGDGVATLSSLQADFPDAARAALALARTADGEQGGVTSWLQQQLGARSVTPRAGDDPDAVLSRTEAALTQGQLDQALQELQLLPAAAQEPLANWQAAAAARRDALQAVDALAAELTSN